MEFQHSKLLETITNIRKWLKHITGLPRMQEAGNKCGFDWSRLKGCLNGEGQEVFTMDFCIPAVILDVEADNACIG